MIYQLTIQEEYQTLPNYTNLAWRLGWYPKTSSHHTSFLRAKGTRKSIPSRRTDSENVIKKVFCEIAFRCSTFRLVQGYVVPNVSKDCNRIYIRVYFTYTWQSWRLLEYFTKLRTSNIILWDCHTNRTYYIQKPNMYNKPFPIRVHGIFVSFSFFLIRSRWAKTVSSASLICLFQSRLNLYTYMCRYLYV